MKAILATVILLNSTGMVMAQTTYVPSGPAYGPSDHVVIGRPGMAYGPGQQVIIVPNSQGQYQAYGPGKTVITPNANGEWQQFTTPRIGDDD
jgi:hypothetical protein